MPTTTTSTTSSQVGAWPGQVSTAVHTTTIADTMVSTIVERCHGWAPTSQPSVGPAAITASTISVSSRPAVAERLLLALDEERVAPEQAQHGRAELGGEVHPEAQPGAGVRPGRRQAVAHGGEATSPVPRRLRCDGRVVEHQQHRRPRGPGRARRRPGRPWSSRAGSAPRSSVRRRATAPSWPSVPVSWVTSGIRRAGNQVATSRSTQMNVIASPMPTKTRATSAAAYAVGEREAALGEGQQDHPAEQHAARAEPVDQQADRDLHPGVHEQLQHRERRQLRRRDVEPLGRGEPGDRERGAVEDRHQVDEEPDHPHRPGASRDGGGLGCHSRESRCGRPAPRSGGVGEPVVESRRLGAAR